MGTPDSRMVDLAERALRVFAGNVGGGRRGVAVAAVAPLWAAVGAGCAAGIGAVPVPAGDGLAGHRFRAWLGRAVNSRGGAAGVVPPGCPLSVLSQVLRSAW